MNNKKAIDAKVNKKNEFYTSLSDIENEINNYKQHFNGKTVICNCDDPFKSNFCKFFKQRMIEWNIKRLITTSYSSEENNRPAYLFDLKLSDLKNDIANGDRITTNEYTKKYVKELEGKYQ